MPKPEDNSPFASDEEVLRTAAEWLVRRDGGLSERERAELAEWCAQDPRHAQAFDRVVQTHARLFRVPEEFFNLPAITPEVEPRVRRRGSRRTLVQALAVAGFAAAACWFLVAHHPAPRPADRMALSYACDTTDHRFVDLADGSTLRLSRGAEVAVDFGPDARRLALRRGQAAFVVAKDASRPFLVSAGVATVRAVGTVFEIRRQADDAIDVSVTEGKVQVSRNDPLPQTAQADQPVFLVAGERISISALGLANAAPEIVHAAEEFSPTRLVLNNTPLKEVVARFNHSSRMQMQIADPRLNEMPMGGVFDARNADAFIHLIETSGDIRVEHVSDTRVLLYSAR